MFSITWVMTMYLIIVFMFVCLSTHRAEGTEVLLTEEKIKRYSEYVGYTLGRDFQRLKIPCDAEAVAAGVRKFAEGSDPTAILGEQDQYEVVLQIQSELFDKKAAENVLCAQNFFSELKKKPSIVTLEEDALCYEVINEGTGTAIVTDTSIPFIY